MLLSAPSILSSLSITVLHSTTPSPHIPPNPWHIVCLLAPGIPGSNIAPEPLLARGASLSVRGGEVSKEGSTALTFLKACGLPAPVLVRRTQDLAAPFCCKQNSVTFVDQREAATRMGRRLVKHSGLQAGISPSCLSSASSARGLN